MITGTVRVVDLPSARAVDRRPENGTAHVIANDVALARRWRTARSPLRHILTEKRTYDRVVGSLGVAEGTG